MLVQLSHTLFITVNNLALFLCFNRATILLAYIKAKHKTYEVMLKQKCTTLSLFHFTRQEIAALNVTV